MVYVLYDPEVNGYLKAVCGRSVTDWRDAKHYKRLGPAISPSTGAGLMNVSRNIPHGYPGPTKHYSNRPNVEVHEFDSAGNFVKSHAAPPVYMEIELNPPSIKYVDKNGLEL